MPTYEYQCDGCQRVFEVRQRISEPPLTTCDACGGQVRRLIGKANFILKGAGWYVTDYPSEARKKAMKSESPSSDAKSSTATSGGGQSTSSSGGNGGGDGKAAAAGSGGGSEGSKTGGGASSSSSS